MVNLFVTFKPDTENNDFNTEPHCTYPVFHITGGPEDTKFLIANQQGEFHWLSIDNFLMSAPRKRFEDRRDDRGRGRDDRGRGRDRDRRNGYRNGNRKIHEGERSGMRL